MENLPILIEKLNNPNTFIRESSKFKEDYNELFKDSPMLANSYLLICEIADKDGRLKITNDELISLFNMRFKNPEEYQL